MKKVLVIGAGPLGSVMASRLTEAKVDVTLMARGKRLEDIKKYGIVLEEEGSGKETATPVKATSSFGAEDEYDLVMVVMRKNQALQLLPDLAVNKKVPTFLFLANNAAGPDKYVAALGKERVMMGFPMPGGERVGHKMRIVAVDEAHVYEVPIGEVDGTIKERTTEVAELMRRMRGYKVDVRNDIDNWLKYHVALLMPAFAPAMIAAGIKMKRMGRTRDLMVLAFRGIKEAFKGLEKSGIPVTPAKLKVLYWIPEPVMIAVIRKVLLKEMMKSSVEGHIRSGADELKYLANEIMPIIRKSDVPTPSIDRLLPFYEGNGTEIPVGSKEMPLKWGGVIWTLVVVAVLIAILVLVF